MLLAARVERQDSFLKEEECCYQKTARHDDRQKPETATLSLESVSFMG